MKRFCWIMIFCAPFFCSAAKANDRVPQNMFPFEQHIEPKYLKLHCGIDRDGLLSEKNRQERQSVDSRALGQAPMEIEIKIEKGEANIGFGGIRDVSIDMEHGVVRFNLLQGSRRKYFFSKETGEFLKKVCAQDIGPALDYIKQHEFRHAYNDIYDSKDPALSKIRVEILPIGGWRLVSWDFPSTQTLPALDFKNISPVSPVYLSSPVQTCAAVKSKEEFRQMIEPLYWEMNWLRRGTAGGIITTAQRAWTDSLNIDFSKQMVIGVFFGPENVLPYKEIGIEAIRDEKSQIRVDYYLMDTGRQIPADGFNPYPYFDLVVCDRREAPVVFYRNNGKAGYSSQDNIAFIQKFLKLQAAPGQPPLITPLSNGPVTAVYPQLKFYGVDKNLNGEPSRAILSVNENGEVGEIKEPWDYEDGLVLNRGFGEPERVAAAALMFLQRSRFGASDADLLGKIIAKTTPKGNVYFDRQEEPELAVFFDRGGRFTGFKARGEGPIIVLPEDFIYIVRHIEPLIKALESGDYAVRELALNELVESHNPLAIAPLITYLKKDKNLQARAFSPLVKIGKPAVEPLIAELEAAKGSDSAVFRSKVADILREIKDPRAVDALVKMLSDEDAHARNQAAEALGEIGDPRSVEPLIVLLKKEKYADTSGVRALTAIGKPAVEPLITALSTAREPDENSRVFKTKIIEILGNIKDPRAVEPLLGGLQEKDWAIPDATAEALTKIGDKAVAGLIAALHSEVPRNRSLAARALGKIKDLRAAKPLTLALNDSDKEVRKEAAIALGEMNDPDAVGPLVKILADPNADVAGKAAEALGKIEDPKSIKSIVQLLKSNPDKRVRQKAFFALGCMGDLAMNTLVSLLKDEDQEIRLGAVSTLMRMAANYYVGYHLKDTEPALKAIFAFFERGGADAIRFEERMHLLAGLKDPRAVRVMLKALKNKEDWYSESSGYQDAPQAFVLAFSKMGEYAIDPLIDALEDEDANVRTGAASAFSYLPFREVAAKRAVESLTRALRDQAPKVRANAARALGAIKDSRAVEPLITVLKNKRESQDVRLAAAAAFRNFKGPNIDAVFQEIKNDRSEGKEIREALRPPEEIYEEIYREHPEFKAAREKARSDIVGQCIAVLKDPNESHASKSRSITYLMNIKNLSPKGLLLFLLDYKDPALNRFAAEVLKPLAGQDFGGDPQKIREWIKQNPARLEEL